MSYIILHTHMNFKGGKRGNQNLAIVVWLHHVTLPSNQKRLTSHFVHTDSITQQHQICCASLYVLMWICAAVLCLLHPFRGAEAFFFFLFFFATNSCSSGQWAFGSAAAHSRLCCGEKKKKKERDWTTIVVNLHPRKIYETQPNYSGQSINWHYWSDEGSIWDTINHIKLRIDRHFSH